jgi:hypothetical protein
MKNIKDIIGVVRNHRWISAEEQRERIEADGCRTIVQLGGRRDDEAMEGLILLARPGTVLKLTHAFLLGDPNTTKKGGFKASFDAAVEAITERRGGTILDMETNLTTAKPNHRKAIVAVAHDHIARSNQGLSSALNGAKSHGRPKAWTDPKERQIIWDEWHSVANKTNVDAVKAATKRIGRDVYYHTMWRVVREMRKEKGMPEAGGASGRAPGNPAFRKARRRAKSKKRLQKSKP